MAVMETSMILVLDRFNSIVINKL